MKDTGILHTLISRSGRIAITVHVRPDGDAIGSGIAMLAFLTETMRKDALLVLPTEVVDSLKFAIPEAYNDKVIVHSESKERSEKAILDADLVICQDFPSFNRTETLEGPLAGSKAKKVLIDHHINPDRAAFDLVFSRTDISSASELLFWILMEMPEIEGDAARLPRSCADALLAGMTTDTNNFANSVYPSTLEMASKLIAAGVDRDGIITDIYNSYRENRVRLMGYLLYEKLRITPEGMAYIIFDEKTRKDFGILEGETEGFVNIPLSIKEVRMSGFFTEDSEKGQFRVSLRSKRGVSANRCSNEFFNGGGHEQAAGGKVFKKDIATPDELEKYILKVSSEFLGQGSGQEELNAGPNGRNFEITAQA